MNRPPRQTSGFFWSFRLKTILGIAAIEALLLTLLIGSILDYLRQSNERQLQDRATTTAALFVTTTKDAVIASDLAALESFVDELMKNPDLVYARVLDVDDVVLAERGMTPQETPLLANDRHVEAVDDGVFDVSATIEEAGIGFGHVEFGLDILALKALQADARRYSLVIAGIEMILVALFSFILGLYLTRQLGALTRASHVIAAGELGYQIQVRGRDELAETATAFNQMSRQLEVDAARRDAVMRSALDCIITADEHGRIEEFNPAAEATFGYRRSEVIGRELITTLIPEQLQQPFRAQLQHYIGSAKTDGSGGGQRMETFARHADGHEFAVEVAFAVTEVAERMLLTLYMRDITERRSVEERLRNLYRAVEQSTASVLITDLDGKIEFVNAKFVEVTGYSVDEVLGQNPRILQSGQTPQSVYQELWQTITSGREWQAELLNRKKSGELFWEWISITPVRNNDGVMTHYVAVKEDITARKISEDKLKLAASVFTHSREGIGITSADGRFIEVNAAFARITGYARDELVGKTPRIMKSGLHGPAFYSTFWHDLIEDGYWHGEIWNKRKNGELFAAMLTISAVYNAQGEIQQYVALYSDITAQKEQQRQLEYIAHYDALTSLPNRVLMADRLNQAMVHSRRREQGLAVVYLDLDGFKEINDTFGHEYGDQLLTNVAHRMKESLRDGDTISRLGGDEFVAVLTDLKEVGEASPILKRLLVAAAQPVHINGQALQVSASLGVTFFPQPEVVDADQLLRQADQAMYQAKLAGKNRYHIFDAELDRNMRVQHEIVERLDTALNQNELLLHYQPKVNMSTGELLGVEALIRWQHPEKGLLQPQDFLPYIESHNFAVGLGEWVIDSALSQIDRWQAQGLGIPVSVNVAGIQLQQSDFIARLQHLLASHPGVKPGMLELELLETSALENMVHASKVMQQCREIGVNFAIDDFGTGYSSLTYLKRLPATHLKIDRSFVKDMLNDPEDLAILEGVLGLATAFRHQAVAEGVETVEHGVMLLKLGCQAGQGYAIAHPMPAENLPGWLDSWSPDPLWQQQRRLSREDQPLIFAGVEHRAWIRAISEQINGNRMAPPPLEEDRCRFGQWLHDDGMRRYGANPTFQKIIDLHHQVHHMAARLLLLQEDGHIVQAREGLTDLYTLRDALLGELDRLVEEHNR